MMKKENEGKVELLELEIPKLTLGNGIRSVMMIAGIVTVIIGALLMLTIILFLPGMSLMLLGLVMFVLNAPKSPVICPSCEYENKSYPPIPSVKCDRCKTNIPIKWIKADKKRRGA